MVEEGKALADKPHIVISTPGRLADHINTGTNFSLKKLRFLVGEVVAISMCSVHVFYEILYSSDSCCVLHSKIVHNPYYWND